jgi:hypothetical protein
MNVSPSWTSIKPTAVTALEADQGRRIAIEKVSPFSLLIAKESSLSLLFSFLLLYMSHLSFLLLRFEQVIGQIESYKRSSNVNLLKSTK